MKRQDEVGKGAGEGYQRHSQPTASQVIGIHLHRLRPAKANDEQQQKTQQVDVLDGIEGKATHAPSGAVALHVSGKSVAELVDGETDDEAGHPDTDDQDERDRILSQQVETLQDHVV